MVRPESVSASDQQSDFVGPFMEDYFAESEDHLNSVRGSLLALESTIGRGRPPKAVIEDLFRSFHSLKGLSAMVELREAERLAHEVESFLRAIRDHGIALTVSGFEALIDCAGAMEQVIAARRARTAVPAITQQLARVAAACAAGGSEHTGGMPDGAERIAPSGGHRVWKVTFTPSLDLVARGIKVDTIRGRLAGVGRIQSVTPRVMSGGGISFEFHVVAESDRAFLAWRDDGVVCDPVSGDPQTTADESVDAIVPATSRAADAAPAPANFVRVDLARLDDLMRLVADLVVSRARLEDTMLRVERFIPAAEWRSLQEQSESIERRLRDLREGVMRVRLVPVGEIFRRMPFVVRDLAKDSGRRIQLELVGQTTEIDKLLIERMMDPVLHLVRNAISHGVETPEERIAAGKRPDGTIRLAASTVGESVILEVSDDGRGMNADDVRQRARASGLDVPGGAVDSQVLLDIICAPGFSTRDEADRASGRGVGMAVVRDTVQELGGMLSVETAVGRGTTFRMVLPLTLAIAEALIVHVADHSFAVPQSVVREVTEVDIDALRTIENNELMTHRGVTLPVVRLARLFSIDAPRRQHQHVIVIGTGLGSVGILVDRISGQREIVVKALHDPLVRVAGVSGATELGDGRLVLILDLAALTRKLRGRTPARVAI
jgi:two-component system chemotaxis sensor kinase CheA